MKPYRHLRASLLALALGLGVATVASYPLWAAEAEAIRAEVGKPLQAAQEAIKSQKYKDALAKVREAEQVGGLSPYETFLADQLRGSAASGAGDYALAAKSFESALASGRVAQPDQLRLVQAVAGLHYQAKDYAKAASWAARYAKEGGTDPQIRGLVGQSYYQAGDYQEAAKALLEQIKAEEQAGQPVPETQLQLLANSYIKLNDLAGYGGALEKLVAHYPKAEYWTDLVQRVSGRPGFAARLSLDASRLALATGTLATTDQYVEFIELALQAGLPGEAKAVVDKGYAAGVLGSGPDAERHKRLKDLATRNAQDDLKSLAKGEQEAAAQPDGTGLVNTGLDYVGHGQADKGAQLIEQGLQKGNLKRPDDAKLHLGYAYLVAGKKDKAVQVLKSVQGSDGTADLARLWVLHATRA